ncbi:ATP-dependent helicase HepA [Legionella santicrucis]|uniref:ATP-dependent helicase HepA n=1 Tax=Legionella santicrucis TaxID=45074 RepID=A0A0W0ZM90_9GAMM|nr:helicase-related protein [Legionella santicrucis]KTD69998.1 ATP-dependent helicase HepA [Legionella santicrucis]
MKKTSKQGNQESRNSSYHSDLTFIVNDGGKTLLHRFKALIKDAQFFDSLVGYFYTTGFFKLYPVLEQTEKIRILVGINTDPKTFELTKVAEQNYQTLSDVETKEKFSSVLASELEISEDTEYVEKGINKFINWINSEKLEIRAYPRGNIHSKLYIFSFKEDDRDQGRIITGSSNFTASGLVDNLEFNVELKNNFDYQFAKTQFEKLWEDAVPLEEIYTETIQTKTWLNDQITPYQLYLKFLYEYFKNELNVDEGINLDYLPDNFKKLEYQSQAVLNAKKILDEYGGVFLSDVVGLGKTYMAAMLASQLDGRTLVIAPPVLLTKENAGSWPDVFSDFNISVHYESLGKLDILLNQGTEGYKNVIVDESHRFRTETTISYDKLARICRNKRVILVSATPLNNTPTDLLSQIKLFQNGKDSNIPNVRNLEVFFRDLEQKINKLDRQKDREEYLQTIKDNANKIRESVLKHIMIRRTRKEIEKYFSDDLKTQGLEFPEVIPPEPIYYQLNEIESHIFDKSLELVTQEFKYARYKFMRYFKKRKAQEEIQTQENLSKFMKILLIKRLESSFHAFKKTIGRFINNYELFLREFEAGHVYLSKKYASKIFELLENDDDESIQRLIEEDKAKHYSSEDFSDNLKEDLETDLQILYEIRKLWGKVERDPKIDYFVHLLSTHPILKQHKIIVFTESKETAEYLDHQLNIVFPNKILLFTSSTKPVSRQLVVDNFDARARAPKNDYRILVTTEILAEGVNLHASNTVINYDIPWNPTRLRQRVGRINRVDTPFKKIYSFNFFPTKQSNEKIKLQEAAEAKIQSFITLLGDDAHLLTETEVLESHELFSQLTYKNILQEEDDSDSELKYFQTIREVQKNNPELFELIKGLPKKARTAKETQTINGLLTFFRKNKIEKFFLTTNNKTKELDFIEAAKLLESNVQEERTQFPDDYFDKLHCNKKAFKEITAEKIFQTMPSKSRDSSSQLLKYIKAIFRDTSQLTAEQVGYIHLIQNQIKAGALPKHTIKQVLEALKKHIGKVEQNLLGILCVLREHIPKELLASHFSERTDKTSAYMEVILSAYFKELHP